MFIQILVSSALVVWFLLISGLWIHKFIEDDIKEWSDAHGYTLLWWLSVLLYSIIYNI